MSDIVYNLYKNTDFRTSRAQGNHIYMVRYVCLPGCGVKIWTNKDADINSMKTQFYNN